MSDMHIRKELVDAIKDKGQDVDKFTNHAVEVALKDKPFRRRKQSRYSDCCFCDDHCLFQ